jgi:hypothetical protein
MTNHSQARTSSPQNLASANTDHVQDHVSPFLLSLVPPPSPGSGFLYIAYTLLGIMPGVLATP